ncbi:uncharacterized protein [Procambarus clarkii]|uniref:uncharacterized protein n=1 Tax=Procambarus clarkii TaxID=6728 RepID=UPI0037433EA0
MAEVSIVRVCRLNTSFVFLKCIIQCTDSSTNILERTRGTENNVDISSIVRDNGPKRRTQTSSSLRLLVQVNVQSIPVSAWDIPVSAWDIPVSAWDIPVSAWDIPVSAWDIPVSAWDIPVSAWDIPVETKEDLEQLILLEDFKDCLSRDLKMYLEEQQVETLSAAATMAEEYILTHRPSAKYVPKTYSRYPARHKPEDKTAPRSAAKTTSDSPRRISPKRDVLCWTCGKRGHIAARCRGSTGNNPRREVMLMNSIVPPTSTLEMRKGLFAPYTSQGHVASGSSSKPVVILRDSGAAQSLILETSLPEGISADEMQKVILGGFPSTLYVAPLVQVHLNSQHFKEEQKKDPQVRKLADTVDSPTKGGDLYVWSNDVLRRRHPPKYPQSSAVGDQIVVPAVFRSKLLETAHANRFAGHGGISKTFQRLAKGFYWPHMKEDVRRFCKTCHACQVAGKANQPVPKAPLYPIPSIGEPFEHLILDIVGPLPPATSGVQYLLTILDRVSRYPEAIPLKTITARVLVKQLLWFISRYGLPKTIQTDQGSNFMSHLFRQQIAELGIQQITSSAYHPESQGALERFHQTLKGMLRKFCYDRQSKWVEELPYLLFAVRSVPNESLGISPFEMIFGHSVRGPLEVARDHWLDAETNEDIVDWLSTNKGRLFSAWEMATRNLENTQRTIKGRYDRRTKQREFQVGDLVLVCTPTITGSLSARFVGPYPVVKKVTNLNYLLSTPDRRKKETLVHVNMIKRYEGRDTLPVTLVTTNDDIEEEEEVLTNSDILLNLQAKLTHVAKGHQSSLLQMIRQYEPIFDDVPGLTSVLRHDVELEEGVRPIKQHPYRLNPLKKRVVKEEVDYMLKHHLIAPSSSPWSSPILLVPKPGKKYRLCIDYRQVNKVTVADTYPLPRVEECLDAIGKARYLTKFDLFKGYWQVPLTEKAKPISAFVTPDGLFECQVMPFGMKNAASTFQRLMGTVLRDVENTLVYIDDVLIYDVDWQDHLRHIEDFFKAMLQSGLVVNLHKSEFARTSVVFLGHKVGGGWIAPKASKIEAIVQYPTPATRKDILRFLGMAGFYRKFVPNFSSIATPLTNLLKKGVKLIWNENCQKAFESLKAILISSPILRSPSFEDRFILTVDASDYGLGSVLSQTDEKGVEHPVAYHSKKFTPSQLNYSVIEKETLALINSVQHFEVYLTSNGHPILVRTDHNPLKFLAQFRQKNLRLTRWSLHLQQYPLQIEHIKGVDNVVADALSRI